MITRFVLFVALCASSSVRAAPTLFDDAPRTSRQGWLVAQAPQSPATSAEIMTIDRRIADVLADRPTTGRVTAGAVLTVLGGLTLAGGAGIFFAFLSKGLLSLVALLVGLPVMTVGLAMLIPGLVLWVTGLAGQREADDELAALRARRGQLISAPPTPLLPPEQIPQVWRSAPRPAFLLARF